MGCNLIDYCNLDTQCKVSGERILLDIVQATGAVALLLKLRPADRRTSP